MSEQLEALFAAVAEAESVLILPHNDPDPDALAAAVALHYLLNETLPISAEIAYRGIIGRAENKALVRYLAPPLHHLMFSELNHSSVIALVDTQPGAGNNPLNADEVPAIVIDHHPLRPETTAVRFADVRVNMGASSTILTEYLQAAGLPIPVPIATALFYGIQTDTMSLSRGASPADVAAFFYLQPQIDVNALVDIERAQIPASYFQSLADALQTARIHENLLTAYIGAMAYPDMTAEIADLFQRQEGIQWVMCLGAYKEHLILAVRSRNQRGGAGQLAQAIIGERGTAGGHGTMAGGQIPLDGTNPAELAAELTLNGLKFLEISPTTSRALLAENEK